MHRGGPSKTPLGVGGSPTRPPISTMTKTKEPLQVVKQLVSFYYKLLHIYGNSFFKILYTGGHENRSVSEFIEITSAKPLKRPDVLCPYMFQDGNNRGHYKRAVIAVAAIRKLYRLHRLLSKIKLGVIGARFPISSMTQNRNARIALLHYQDGGQKDMFIYPRGVQVGEKCNICCKCPGSGRKMLCR